MISPKKPDEIYQGPATSVRDSSAFERIINHNTPTNDGTSKHTNRITANLEALHAVETPAGGEKTFVPEDGSAEALLNLADSQEPSAVKNARELVAFHGANEQYPALTNSNFLFSEDTYYRLGEDIADHIEQSFHDPVSAWSSEKQTDTLGNLEFQTQNYLFNAVARNMPGYGLDILGQNALKLLKRDAKQGQASKALLQEISNSYSQMISATHLGYNLIDQFTKLNALDGADPLEKTAVGPDPNSLSVTDGVWQSFVDQRRVSTDQAIVELNDGNQEAIRSTVPSGSVDDLITHLESGQNKSHEMTCKAITEILINIAQNNPELINQAIKTESKNSLLGQVTAKFDAGRAWVNKNIKTTVAAAALMPAIGLGAGTQIAEPAADFYANVTSTPESRDAIAALSRPVPVSLPKNVSGPMIVSTLKEVLVESGQQNIGVVLETSPAVDKLLTQQGTTIELSFRTPFRAIAARVLQNEPPKEEDVRKALEKVLDRNGNRVLSDAKREQTIEKLYGSSSRSSSSPPSTILQTRTSYRQD